MDNFERLLAASMKVAAVQRPDVEPASNKRRASLMALAAAVVIGSVIAGTSLLFNPSNSPGPADSPTSSVINLEGRWMVSGLYVSGPTVSHPVKPEPVSSIRVTFSDGIVTIDKQGGCAYYARYSQSGKRGMSLAFTMRSGFLVTHDAACIGQKRLYRALLDVRRASESKGVLSLLDEDGSTIATLERVSTQPINLEGKWKVTALTDAQGRSALSGPYAQTLRLSFEGEMLGGQTGCSKLLGRYEQGGNDGRDLEITYVEETEGVCSADFPPLRERLQDVRHVSEANGKLQLHADNWMIIAVLERESVDPAIDLGDRDPAIWKLAPNQTLNENTTDFDVLVTRSGCNSGVTGSVSEPMVVFRTGEIAVAFTVRHSNGGRCPSNDAVPVTVHLDQPIGNRILVDGQCSRTDLETTAFCQSDQGVRWAD